MGALVWECDHLIPGMLDRLNLRFGPAETAKVGDAYDNYAGIAEMAELQREFQIFKKGRPLSKSVNALGLAGFESARAKNRWLRLLDSLPNQGAPIVDKIVENLASSSPKPMHFQAVRYTGDKNPTVEESGRHPVPYDETHPYIVVSIPMGDKHKKDKAT